MPLWMQAVIEILLTAIGSLLFVVVIVFIGWFTLGMPGSVAVVLGGSGQLWLAGHGVGLHLNIPSDTASGAVQGIASLTPLGLTAVLLLFVRRAGKRLARASYEGQFWQAILGGVVTYGVISVAVSLVTSSSALGTHPVASAIIPPWVLVVGMLWGGHRVAGSWLRLVGIDPDKLSEKYSQYSRWTGAYLVSLVKAASLAVVGLVGVGALLTGLSIFVHWNRIISLYQGLHAGAVGDLAVTLLQLALLPNLVIFGLAWGTGAGFSLGTGTIISPAATNAGALPTLPILGAVPSDPGVWGYAVLVLPVVIGALAGWYFIRDGENHLDEWFTLRLSWRWLAAVLSGLTAAIGLGLLVGIVSCLLAALAHGSLGVGRFTDVGPNPWLTGAWAAVTVGIGTLIGQLLGPWIERDPSTETFAAGSSGRRRSGKSTAGASAVGASGADAAQKAGSKSSDRTRSRTKEAASSRASASRPTPTSRTAPTSQAKPTGGRTGSTVASNTGGVQRVPKADGAQSVSTTDEGQNAPTVGEPRTVPRAGAPRRGSDGKGPLPPRGRGSTRFSATTKDSAPDAGNTPHREAARDSEPAQTPKAGQGSSRAPWEGPTPQEGDSAPNSGRGVAPERPVIARPPRRPRKPGGRDKA